jgi:predicted transposase YbfD/YdcC
VLDVGFREDARKARAGNITANYSMVTRMAHNILRQDTETDGGIEIKRKQAG